MYGIDIVNLQETHITENTFSECEFIAQNFDVVYNNAASQFGTCIQISSAIKHENVKMDNYGRVIIYDLPDLNITGGNVYLQSGSSSEDKKCRENYAGMILPQLLVEKRKFILQGRLEQYNFKERLYEISRSKNVPGPRKNGQNLQVC